MAGDREDLAGGSRDGGSGTVRPEFEDACERLVACTDLILGCLPQRGDPFVDWAPEALVRAVEDRQELVAQLEGLRPWYGTSAPVSEAQRA